eukprot:scaffold40_cov413-Prasinococcus_capsulatus_cf.AAC.13
MFYWTWSLEAVDRQPTTCPVGCISLVTRLCKQTRVSCEAETTTRSSTSMNSAAGTGGAHSVACKSIPEAEPAYRHVGMTLSPQCTSQRMSHMHP